MTTKINVDTHPSSKWDSKPRSSCSRGLWSLGYWSWPLGLVCFDKMFVRVFCHGVWKLSLYLSQSRPVFEVLYIDRSVWMEDRVGGWGRNRNKASVLLQRPTHLAGTRCEGQCEVGVHVCGVSEAKPSEVWGRSLWTVFYYRTSFNVGQNHAEDLQEVSQRRQLESPWYVRWFFSCVCRERFRSSHEKTLLYL
jgi:hypothetical protein